MASGWTPAHYSLLRALFGLYLAMHIARWMPWGGPAVAGLMASLALIVGFRDRLAAVVVAGALVASTLLVGGHREPVLPILLWLLSIHAFAVAGAPFGSWDARGRLDPANGWRLPRWVLIANRIVLLLAIGLVAASLLPRSLALLLLALFSFDPGWIRRRDSAAPPALVLYDGGCGFCHASIRVLLAEDPDGRSFRFAPLESDRARAALRDEQRRAVGDTIVVLTAESCVLSRSTAVSYIGGRLGGLWRAAAEVLTLVPARVRDAAYDGVARIRHRLVAAPKEACPLLPPHLRGRFEA
jgi:predicted DCC family thiol-disulfide oxidoreductase YuxK